MINSNLLKSHMALHSVTQLEMANRLGISTSTLNNKINNKVHFTVEEAKQICTILQISDNDEKANIFFS